MRFPPLIYSVFLSAALLSSAPSGSTLQPPFRFEPNRGQAGSADFIARGPGYLFEIRPKQLTMQLTAPGKGATDIRIDLVGSRAAAAEPLESTGGVSNYLSGNNPDKWIRNVPHFGRIRYAGVYSGIDVVYYGAGKKLEYDFVVAPGADPRQIALRFFGARRLFVDSDGDLLIHTTSGSIRQKRPYVYQAGGDTQTAVAAHYKLLTKNTVTVDIGNYDHSRPLVIDPVIEYSTYLGGSGSEFMGAVAVDPAGNIYVGGATNSVNFPVQSPYQSRRGSLYDLFITKFTTAGTVVYSTYLGGDSTDNLSGLKVDSVGAVYITGQITSTNFPMVNAYQSVRRGATDAFVAKLNPAGSALEFSTRLGGSSDEWAFDLALDASGNVIICGFTGSPDFPTASPAQAARVSGNEGFVAKFNPTASALIYSTYLGGSGNDYANALTVDNIGNAWIFGDTAAANFPLRNPIQSVRSTGVDATIARLSPVGVLEFSTYLGGNGTDAVRAGIVDATGTLYATGETSSTNLPTINASQNLNGGGVDAMLIKLSPGATSWEVLAYYGGSGDDLPKRLAIDAAGRIFISGVSSSANLPVLNPVQPAIGGGSDAFVAQFTPNFGTLMFGTWLGGTGQDVGIGLTLDAAGNAIVAGNTASTNFPTANPFQASSAGLTDAFLTRIGLCSVSASPLTHSVARSGGTGTILINAGNGCPWTAVSNSSWLTFSGSASGTGNGAIDFVVAANPGTQRTGRIDIGTQAVTVNQSGGPVLSSVAPTGGAAGTSVNVTLTGAGFISPATVNASSGITVSNVLVVNATTITATFAIPVGATPGTATVSVTTADGTTATVPFSITPPLPTLSSVTPATGTAGTTVAVTFTGSDFTSPATINAGPSITVSNVVVVNPAQITASFVIAAGASAGATPVSVTTQAGTSGTVSFNITPAPPTLASMTPTSGVAGSNVNVTLTGTGFAAPATINAGASITVSNIVVVNATQITATFGILASAATGPVPVSVTTPAGTTGNVSFNITPVVPVLASINPPSGTEGTSVNVTLTGSNFTAPATINAGGSITVSNIVVVNATQITARFAIASGATQGAVPISVTTGSGTSGNASFSITPASLVLTSVTPGSGIIGSTVNVTLAGSNFTSPASINAGASITVSNIVVVGPTQITARFTISSGAMAGTVPVSVTTLAGTTGIVPFSITSGTPAVLSAVRFSPTTIVSGKTTTTNTVEFATAVPADTVVTLSSTNPSVVSVPTSVTVPAGSRTATFNAVTTTVAAPVTVTVGATYNGVARYTNVIVEPFGIKKVSLIPKTTTGGVPTTFNTVLLNDVAPAGGIAVTLTSSNPSVAQPPATITVPVGGTSSAYFIIPTSTVTSTTSVTITATYNGRSMSAVLTVTP